MAFEISCNDDYLKILGYFPQKQKGWILLSKDGLDRRRPTHYKLFTGAKDSMTAMRGIMTN